MEVFFENSTKKASAQARYATYGIPLRNNLWTYGTIYETQNTGTKGRQAAIIKNKQFQKDRMDNNITIDGSPASRTRSASKKHPSAQVIGSDTEMVPVDLEGSILAVAADPGVILPKPTPLYQADYFQMDEGEPPGSGGGTDSDEHVLVPPNLQVHEPNVVSPADGDDDNDEGHEVVVLPPKDLTS